MIVEDNLIVEVKTHKKCSKCGIDKILSEYTRDRRQKDGYHYQCKDCRNENYNKNRKKFKEFYQNYKSERGCKFCGEDRPWVLVFHHPDKSKKKRIVKTISHFSPNGVVKEELEGCWVLCSNCHITLHYEQRMKEKFFQEENRKNQLKMKRDKEVEDWFNNMD